MVQELSPRLREIVIEEENHLAAIVESILDALRGRSAHPKLEEEIMMVRDQISEAHPDDLASLIAHLTRLISLRETVEVKHNVNKSVNIKNPYFAHLKLAQYKNLSDDAQESDDAQRSTDESDLEKEIDQEISEILDAKSKNIEMRDIFLGKRFYADPSGKFIIVDWRDAPIAKIYYKHQEGDTYQEANSLQVNRGIVMAKRALSIQNSVLENIQGNDYQIVKSEDGQWTENLKARKYQLEGGHQSAFRTPAGRLGVKGKYHLPEITALIDPQQFESISTENSGVMIIQGGAGTGKTTIALHRIAYLNYQNPKKFRASKILMITPGEALKRYVSEVLPALGFTGVKIDSISNWAFQTVKKIIKYTKRFDYLEDHLMNVQKIKRHPLMIRYIERHIESKGKQMEEQILNYTSHEGLNAWVARRNLPLIERIRFFQKYIHEKQLKTGEITQYLKQTHQELEEIVEIWVELLSNEKELKSLFRNQNDILESDIETLVKVSREQARQSVNMKQYAEDLQIGADGRSAIQNSYYESKLDVDDCMIMLKICQLLFGKLQSYYFDEENEEDVGFDQEDDLEEVIENQEARQIKTIHFEHIVVDEAQDLSPLCLQVLCDIPPPNAPITLAGDTAQRVIFNNGFSSWQELMPYLPRHTQLLEPLLVSYRSTRQILALSKHVLGNLNHQWETRDARNGAKVELLKFREKGQAVAFLADALNLLFENEFDPTVALIAKTAKVADFYYEGLMKSRVPRIRRVENQDFNFTSGIDVTDVYQVKGLEFDYVILLETTEQYYEDCTEDRHLLHVAMTRSAHQLWMICTAKPTTLLPESLIEDGEFDL
jgi:DNA helicase-2/ATP-dependent DNA helicase PcrA